MTILKKEWLCFLGSDRGIFILYIVLVVSWSMMLAAPPGETVSQAGPLWLIFFSVIISANFSNTVFIAERVNGILEILLTSGMSRRNILFGKMAFVTGMSIGIGLICILLSQLWQYLLNTGTERAIAPGDIVVFCSAVFMNTASSAFLSVKMGNPRLLHIANLFLLGGIVGTHSLLTLYMPVPSWMLSSLLLLLGIAGTAAAIKLYESEKILQPVSL